MTTAPPAPTAASATTSTTSSAAATPGWRGLALLVATPALATVMGLALMPHPQGVAAEQAAFDRGVLGDVILQAPPLPTSAIDATLGGVVRIRGADLPDVTLSRGARAQMTLYFEVVGPVDSDWQVFVHIDPQEGGARGRINADHFPASGRYPSSLWRPGELIRDRFEQTVPRGAAAGIYDVWVGLYSGDTRLPLTAGERRLHDGDNRVRVGQITVEYARGGRRPRRHRRRVGDAVMAHLWRTAMDTLTALRTRHSSRAFSARPVDDELLLSLVDDAG